MYSSQTQYKHEIIFSASSLTGKHTFTFQREN
jgi:hypothetical protein